MNRELVCDSCGGPVESDWHDLMAQCIHLPGFAGARFLERMHSKQEGVSPVRCVRCMLEELMHTVEDVHNCVHPDGSGHLEVLPSGPYYHKNPATIVKTDCDKTWKREQCRGCHFEVDERRCCYPDSPPGWDHVEA